VIESALGTLTQDRTSIIIAHRLSTVRRADRILVMHHGRLVEQGSHSDLLAKGGIYEKLYRLQYSGS
jgi:ABC-type multidrug transport system fused ATPase/permease subunit